VTALPPLRQWSAGKPRPAAPRKLPARLRHDNKACLDALNLCLQDRSGGGRGIPVPEFAAALWATGAALWVHGVVDLGLAKQMHPCLAMPGPELSLPHIMVLASTLMRHPDQP
jgi:hypothetical protein